MLTQKMIPLICAIATASILSNGIAQAHSGHGHDHATIPVDWKFDSAVEAKIVQNTSRGNRSVGLSVFEQNALSRYGIEVGNTFKTTVKNRTLEITRTSSGLRVEGLALAYADGPEWNLPVRSANPVVRSSLAATHPGHDHRHIGMEWAFPPAIEEKIANNLLRNGASGAIGLKSGEQKLLERYGVEVGNRFNAVVNGMTFTMRRTTMGLRILKHMQDMPVAEVRNGTAGRY